MARFLTGLVIGFVLIVVGYALMGGFQGQTPAGSTQAGINQVLDEINRNTTSLQVQPAGQSQIQFVTPQPKQSPAGNSGKSIADGRSDCQLLSDGQLHCPPQ